MDLKLLSIVVIKVRKLRLKTRLTGTKVALFLKRIRVSLHRQESEQFTEPGDRY